MTSSNAGRGTGDPLTIYECSVCEARSFEITKVPHTAEHSRTGEPFDVRETRMFREEDVRPLYEAAAFGPDLAGDDPPPHLVDAAKAFPAPEEWRSAELPSQVLAERVVAVAEGLDEIHRSISLPQVVAVLEMVDAAGLTITEGASS